VNNAKKVREYFEANRNRDIALDEVRLIVGDGEGGMADAAKTRGVVNYLRTQRNMRLKVVKRGEVWRYDKIERRTVAENERRKQAIARGKVNHSVRIGEADGRPVESDEQAATRLRRIADKLGAAETVPVTEPVVTLRVIGTLKETGEVLVEGDSAQGFERGVWALRKLV
jgi:hypothetical protein